MSLFSSRIICGDCGSFYGSKVWHSTSKYRRTIWQCNSKFKGEHFCSTPHLYEAKIKAKFLNAFAEYYNRRKEIIKNLKMVLATLQEPFQPDDTELRTLEAELEGYQRFHRRIPKKVWTLWRTAVWTWPGKSWIWISTGTIQTASGYHPNLERRCADRVWWSCLECSNRKCYRFSWRQYGVPIQRRNRNNRAGQKNARLFLCLKIGKNPTQNDNKGYRFE